ncbi:MAG: dehydrogenase [Synechococcaceae cyanobacterium ELA445]
MDHPVRPALAVALILGLAGGAAARAPYLPSSDPLTGPRTPLVKDWVGLRPIPQGTPILVMAGHADSQGVGGAGTSGAAVALNRWPPMDPSMTDELYWNLQTAQAVVALGQRRGLNIRFYDPPARTIASGDDPRTTWSVGRNHVLAGGYAMEIHYDAYGPDGYGSGVIPAISAPISRLDESLAAAFGAYPVFYRKGLGGPKRGITILEIGKLEGTLEAALRDPTSRVAALDAIAERVVSSLELGLRPAPGAGDSARQDWGRPASAGGE